MIAAREDQTDKEGYWISELMSLAIEPRRKNELNDINELEALVNNTKQVYYQYYKTAYSVNDIEMKDRFDIRSRSVPYQRSCILEIKSFLGGNHLTIENGYFENDLEKYASTDRTDLL